MAGIEQYLQELDEQVVQEESEILAVRNPNIEVIDKLYTEWDKRNYAETIARYNCVLGLLNGKTFTAKDIKFFSIFLKKYEFRGDFHSIGIFLSALINTSGDTNFELFVEHLHNKISWLGGFNEGKNLIVKGGTERYTGYEMKQGKVSVIGDAGISTGSGSTGGEIHVTGKIGSILDGCCFAKIYQNGVLVWPE